jgi:hypothetical protein
VSLKNIRIESILRREKAIEKQICIFINYKKEQRFFEMERGWGLIGL